MEPAPDQRLQNRPGQNGRLVNDEEPMDIDTGPNQRAQTAQSREGNLITEPPLIRSLKEMMNQTDHSVVKEMIEFAREAQYPAVQHYVRQALPFAEPRGYQADIRTVRLHLKKKTTLKTAIPARFNLTAKMQIALIWLSGHQKQSLDLLYRSSSEQVEEEFQQMDIYPALAYALELGYSSHDFQIRTGAISKFRTLKLMSHEPPITVPENIPDLDASRAYLLATDIVNKKVVCYSMYQAVHSLGPKPQLTRLLPKIEHVIEKIANDTLLIIPSREVLRCLARLLELCRETPSTNDTVDKKTLLFAMRTMVVACASSHTNSMLSEIQTEIKKVSENNKVVQTKNVSVCFALLLDVMQYP